MIPTFFRIETLDSTNSTNLVAKEAAESGEHEGLVVHALSQTAGKGRLGRTWESPEGNLYVSVLLRPRCALQQAVYYSFVAAMAVYDTVLAPKPDACIQLKWPNDVLVDGKKISGVLLETSPTQGGLLDWLVIGVGINVAHHPENALYPTTSLAALGVSPTVEETLQQFLLSLDHWRKTLLYDGFSPIRKAWLADAKMGEAVVKTPSGDITGDFAGIDESGGLILRLANGQETVIQAGDVFFPQGNG
ncbi:MAG TPA: biotin--[acetyl-CoA-carboxylase] ligase [Rhodospirillaceae bacterium]|nr:biotin--[acetyl-CoA-carboxylase] ligase [Rhodospirillaceae bacterium]